MKWVVFGVLAARGVVRFYTLLADQEQGKEGRFADLMLIALYGACLWWVLKQ